MIKYKSRHDAEQIFNFCFSCERNSEKMIAILTIFWSNFNISALLFSGSRGRQRKRVPVPRARDVCRHIPRTPRLPSRRWARTLVRLT